MLHFAFLTRTLSVLGLTIYNLKMGKCTSERISKEAKVENVISSWEGGVVVSETQSRLALLW